MKVFEQAIESALAAAEAIAETQLWIFGTIHDEPVLVEAAEAIPADRFVLLVEFMLENPGVPVDAYWIRAGALGLHPFERRFDELPAAVQLAYKVFRDVLVTVNTAMAEAEAQEIARQEAAELEAKRRAALEAKGPDPDSPFAPIAGPMDPSDLALSLAADKKARELAANIDVPGADAGIDFPDPNAGQQDEGQQDSAPAAEGQQDPAPAKPKRK